MKPTLLILAFWCLFFCFSPTKVYCQAPPSWSFVNTGTNHTILIQSVFLNGQAIQSGDVIGVFYSQPATGALGCAGYLVWNGVQSVVAAWGDDVISPAKDGFDIGEAFQFKVYRPSTGQEFDLPYATYSTQFGTVGGTYLTNGMSIITWMSNLPPGNYFTFSLTCHVAYQGSGAPVPNHAVQVIPSDTVTFAPQTLLTNAQGNITTQLVVNDTATLIVYGLTLGECGPTDWYSQSLTVTSLNPVGVMSLSICQDTLTNPPCQADFDFANLSPTGCYCGDFSNLSTVDAQPASYSWNFGDGTSPSPAINPSHVFANGSGTYQVCLTLSTASGCSAVHCESLFISDFVGPNCQAGFGVLPINFNSPGINLLNQSQGGIDSLFWDFGDGLTSADESQYVFHSYADTGYYQVCLTIWTLDGCVDTTCQTIHYFGQTGGPACTAQFFGIQAPVQTCPAGYTWLFTDQSVTSDSIVAWHYSFGDNTFADVPNPTHCFATAGYFVVSLQISSSSGCVSSSDFTVQVIDTVGQNCEAQFSWNFTSGGDVQFLNASVGQVLNYYWDFGDGNTSTQPNPVHEYAPGTYSPCLTIVTTFGCVDTLCIPNLTVASVPTCYAQFQVVPDVSGTCVGCYHFINQSWASSGSFSSQWSFGDGSFSAETNPTHLFDSIDIYQISLVITSSDGCSHAFSIQLDVTQTGGYSVSGTIQAGGGVMQTGVVHLLSSSGADLSTSPEITGQYQLSGVQTGQYLVYALPAFLQYPNYAPTYFAGSLFWSSASLLNVSSDTSGVDFQLVMIQNPSGGNGSVSGWISYMAGTKVVGYRNLSDESLEGIPVFILDSWLNPVAFCLTDDSGFFHIEGLPYGEYRVVPELTGYQTSPALVTLSETQPTSGEIAFVVSGNAVVLGYSTMDNLASALHLFPNPVGDACRIRVPVGLFQGKAVLQVVSLTGQTLLQDEIAPGGDVMLNTSNLAPGLYEVTCLSNQGLIRERFVKR